MKHIVKPLLIAAFLAVAVMIFSVFASAQTFTPTPSPTPTSTPTPMATPSPSPTIAETPIHTPTPAASPAPTYNGTLKTGDWVQVRTEGDCLNVRLAPGLNSPGPSNEPSPVLNCLKDGFVGLLSSGERQGTTGPVFADGHWWWRIVGQGWVAEDWLVFHHEGGFPWPQRPELATSGYIAYLSRDFNLWLMKADGSEQRLLVSRESENEFLDFLAWHPGGEGLSFSVHGPTPTTKVVDLNGSLVGELAGLVQARWSPDGTRLAALRVHSLGDMGGHEATPVVIDLASGGETPIGPRSMYFRSPVWSPSGDQLAFICTSVTMPIGGPDGSITGETHFDCQGDGLRIVSAEGRVSRIIPMGEEYSIFHSNPSWQPGGKLIALSNPFASQGCQGYILVEVETGDQTACLPLPPHGGFGGRCGSYEDGATDWTPDGRFLLYHWEFGAGQNGVWIADVSTGKSRLVPSISAAYVSVSSDSRHLAFSSDGYIWVADMDGGNLTLLAEGWQPAWQP